MSDESVLKLLDFMRDYHKKPPKHVNKAYLNEKHALKRLKTRYSVNDASTIKDLVDKVRSNSVQMVLKLTGARRIFYSDGYYFIYCKRTGTIVTFLTEEMVNRTKRYYQKD